MMKHCYGLAFLFCISLGAMLLVSMAFPSLVSAADRYVGTEPGDYPTIQDALDAAVSGDTVILRQGTYSEDVTIDKPRIRLIPDFGVEAIIDGNITVTAAAGGALISGILMTEGKNIVVEDGIALPAGSGDQVFALAGGSNSYNVTLGDVTANVNHLPEVSGVYIFALGENSTISHTGIIAVENAAVSAPARGASIVMGNGGEATIDDVHVQAGAVAIGVHFITNDDGQLAMTGNVVAHAREDGSSASGIGVRGQTGVSAALRDVEVEGGNLAVGIDFNVASEGSLTHSGDVRAVARDVGSAAYGVQLGAGDDSSATIGNVTVEGGALARGVTTTYASGTIIVTDGLESDVGIQVGDVHVLARDADSEAYGVDLRGEGNLALTVGNVEVEGGRLARGVWLTTSGDQGRLSHDGNLFATARDAGSEAYGVHVVVGDEFSAAVGNVEASGDGLARGVWYIGGQGGSVVIEGDVTATSASGAAHGLLAQAGGEFQAGVKNVRVEGGGNAVQGVALNVGDGGVLNHEGLIEVAGTSATSNARGVNVTAGQNFSATVGDVVVDGPRNALGIFWESTDGASLTHTGTIRATTTDASGAAGGISIMAGDDFTMTIGDIAASADRTGSQAQGVYVSAGEGFTGSGGDVTVTGHAFATGVDLYVSAAADVKFGNIDVTSVGADSSASGMIFSGGQNAQLTLGDMSVSAATRATGLFFEHRDSTTGVVLDNLRVTQEGSVTAVGSQADSLAIGVFGTVGDDFEGVFGDVAAAAKRTTWGVSLNAGDRATLHVESVETVSEDAGSEAYGVQFTGKDDVAVTLGEVVSRAEEAAWAVTVTGDEGLTLDVDTVTAEAGAFASGVRIEGGSSTVTVRGDVSAAADGAAGVAQALTVESSVADVTNHGHVHASANNGTGVGFGLSGPAERITFHNLGVVETSANTGSAVLVNVTETATVQNDGTIDAGGPVAFRGTNSTGSLSVTNTGTILGSVLMGQGADTLAVSGAGRIVGNVDMGEGTDRFSLESNTSVDGSVSLGVGDDEATIHYGAALTGILDGGAGIDALTLLGDGASSLPPGFAWNWLSARNIEQTWVRGGAWQWGAGTSLGAVDVYDAFLRIDDNIAIDGLHLHDGVLVGEGNVTGNVVNEGGVVAPGNSFGILTITGNYRQGPDGVLYIELDATTAPNAGVNYDQLVIVGGTAIFEDGTTVRVQPAFGPTLPDRAEYLIVDGDVIFDPDAIHLEIALPRRLFFDGWLEEGSMTLILGVTPFDAVAETGNQEAVARALDEARGVPGTDLDDLYDWLRDLDPDQADEARAAYDSLSGEVYTHLPTLASRRLDNLVGAVGRAIPHPTAEPLRKVWVVPYADSGRVVAGSGTVESRFRLSGVIAGVDLFTGSHSRIGLSIGAGWDRLTMDDRASELRGNGHLFGLYGGFVAGRTRFTTLLGYGTTTHRSQRGVRFGDVQRRAEAEFGATDWVMSVEARFGVLSTGGLNIEPVASVGYYSTRYRSFTETGAGTTGLMVDEREANWWRGRLGLEVTGNPWTFGSGTVRPRASLAWVNDFSPVERIHEGRLRGAADNPFTIHGTKAHRSGFEASFGLQSEEGGDAEWSLTYTGEFREDMNSHLVMGRIAFAF